MKRDSVDFRAEVSQSIASDVAHSKAAYEARLQERAEALREACYGDDNYGTMYPPLNRHTLDCTCVAERAHRKAEWTFSFECEAHS